MRTPVKIVLSICCILAGIGGFWFMTSLGKTIPSYAVIFMGLAGVAMTWIFPDVVTGASPKAGSRR